MSDNIPESDAASDYDLPTFGRASSERSAGIEKLAGALAKAQGAMSNAEKTGENPAFKRAGKVSTYATLAAVLDAVRKPLSDNGLSVSQWPRTNGQGVEIETVLKHESGQYMRDTLWLPCPQMTVHTVGSTITYLRRYTLMAIVGVAPEDDDGNAAAEAHKPGVPGSASGGGAFRPAGPRRMSSNGQRLANDDAHLIDTERDKGTTGKPPTQDERAQKIAAKAKAWVDNAAATLRLSGQSVDSLSRFLADHEEQITFLNDHAPTEFERFFEVYNDVADKARAMVGGA
jgi:hypothetical protein